MAKSVPKTYMIDYKVVTPYSSGVATLFLTIFKQHLFIIEQLWYYSRIDNRTGKLWSLLCLYYQTFTA